MGEDQLEHRPAVFQPVGSPEFARVCEEFERGSKSRVEVPQRPSAISYLFGDADLAFLQFPDALFIGRHQRCAVRIDDAVEKLPDLAFDVGLFALKREAFRLRRADPRLPQVAEHVRSQREQVLRRLQRLEKLFEVAFDDLAPDRFARRGAAAREAEVIGIFLMATRRPAAGHRLVAAGAGDEAPQREFLVEVGMRRDVRLPFQPPLDGLIRLIGDQRLMLRRDEVDAPVGQIDIARIDGPVQKLVDALAHDFAAPILRELGKALEKPFDLGLGLKPSRRVAIHRLFHHRGQRFVAHQHFAMAGYALIPIADRGLEHPVAVRGPGPHPVAGLFAVLLALMLGDAGEKVLDEDAV